MCFGQVTQFEGYPYIQQVCTPVICHIFQSISNFMYHNIFQARHNFFEPITLFFNYITISPGFNMRRIRQLIRNDFRTQRNNAIKSSSELSLLLKVHTEERENTRLQLHDTPQTWDFKPLPPLLMLPNELLFLVATYITDKTAMSLGLTCRLLYSSVRELYLQPTKKPDNEVLRRFLPLLDRDLSTHVFCPHCIKLHSIFYGDNCQQRVWPRFWPFCHSTANELLPCWNIDKLYDFEGEISWESSSTMFRMIFSHATMKRCTTTTIAGSEAQKRRSEMVYFSTAIKTCS
jgi:hypothetical protein